jgi:sugar lactone lactonase YvrE
MTAPELVLAAGAALAEGPTWHPTEQVLYWTDLVRGELHRFDPRSGADETVHRGRTLGCFGLRAGGGFVLGTDEGIFRLLDGGEPEPVHAFLRDDPDRRLNDGKVDPQGRFWFGSNRWDFRAGAGALHVLDGTRLETRLPDLSLPNGIDWSPDGRTMYHADSLGEWLDAFEFDPATGALGSRRRVATLKNVSDSPLGYTVLDGLAVDAAGNIWVAVYGSGEVRCYSPSGEVLEVVKVPALAAASVTFGGPDLDVLYIATGASENEHQPEAGAILACSPGVKGQRAAFWIDGA